MKATIQFYQGGKMSWNMVAHVAPNETIDMFAERAKAMAKPTDTSFSIRLDNGSQSFKYTFY